MVAKGVTGGGASRAGRLRLVGRVREREALGEMMRQAADGQGGLAWLSGEPGIGKSRLLRETIEEARASGWSCLLGHAYDSERMPAYLPLAEAASGLLADSRLPEGVRSELTGLLEELSGRAAGGSALLPSDAVRYRLFERAARIIRLAAELARTHVAHCTNSPNSRL